MDPQATWDELLSSYNQQQFDEACAAAEALLHWLERGGFPPVTNQHITTGDELHRVIARAVVQHVLTCCK